MITITSANAPIFHFNYYHYQSNIWALRLLLSLKSETVEIWWKELIESNLPNTDVELMRLECGKIKDKIALHEQEKKSTDSDEFAISEGQWATEMSELVRAAWQERLYFYEKGEVAISNCTIYKNIEYLGDFICLNQAEKTLLFFAVLLRFFSPLKKYLSEFNLESSSHEPFEIEELAMLTISTMLNIDVNNISKALQPTGKLHQICGLELSDDIICDKSIDNVFNISRHINHVLTQVHNNRDALIAKILQKTSPPKLDISDFPHAAKHVDVLTRFLSGAIAKQEKGVNILIHGKPGTGKTELASSLASAINAKLFSVPCTTRMGGQMERKDRFFAYKLCQSVVSSEDKCIILFDEVEDVFVDDYSESSGKAWVNSILESNAVPAIWLTNSIDDIDQAYLRRFDYVLEMPEVTHEVRRVVAERYFGGLSVDSAWIKNLSMQDAISPAQIEKAARVTSLVVDDKTEFCLEKIAETVLECSANALGGKLSLSTNSVANSYDLAYLNTSIDVCNMIEGLKTYPKATFCFYGAPGTGKTALAKHMAERLGKKLMVKRASDITSRFIGGSERNIAQMFRQASDENSVLLLDEADTFLFDRRDAKNSWEVSTVNEMLTWMEDFNGIFICTTNLIEKLDQAALRRFAFKVKFDYLKPEQKRKLFKQELLRLNPKFNEVDEAILRKVETLPSLAPGDFSVVSRQRAVLGRAPSPSDMFDVLQAECIAKGSTSEKIGFLH